MLSKRVFHTRISQNAYLFLKIVLKYPSVSVDRPPFHCYSKCKYSSIDLHPLHYLAVFTIFVRITSRVCKDRLTLMSTLSGSFQGYCHDTLQNYFLRIRSHNSKPHIVMFSSGPAVPESLVRTPITQSSYLSSKQT